MLHSLHDCIVLVFADQTNNGEVDILTALDMCSVMDLDPHASNRSIYDLHIIYDSEHAANDHNHPFSDVKELQAVLDREGYTYTDSVRDNKPGHSTLQQQVNLISQADFVICFLSISSDGEIPNMLAHYVQKAVKIKLDRREPNRVIPVCCAMAEDKIKEILHPGSCLGALSLVDYVIIKDGDNSWRDKIIDTLKITPTGKVTLFPPKMVEIHGLVLLLLDHAMQIVFTWYW